jgi:hypothetical protein
VSGADAAKKVDTFERVMPRCRTAKGVYVTQTAEAAACVLAPSHAPPGAPRVALRERAFAEAAAAEVEAAAPKSVLLAARPGMRPPPFCAAAEEFEIGSMNTMTAPPADATLCAQNAVKARAARRAATGPSPPPPDTAAEMGAAARADAYESAAACATDLPLTYAGARAAEGAFPLAFPPPRQLVPALGDAASALPKHCRIPGAELSLAPLATRVERRLRAVGASLASVAADARARAPATLARAAAAARALIPPRAPAEPPAGDDCVPATAFRDAAHAARSALLDADLEAIVRAAAPVAIAQKSGDDAQERWVSLSAVEAIAQFAVL